MTSTLSMDRRFVLAGLAMILGGGAAPQQLGTKRDGAWVAKVLAAPQSVHPLEYADLVEALWTRGDKAQATFWFYMFQARTLPWAMAEAPGGGVNAVRAVVNQNTGAKINGWVAADLAVWKELGGRAISYEPKVPLIAQRPNGYDQTRWLALVTQARQDYASGFREFTRTVTAEELAKSRRSNGLASGPLRDQGAPLPETWR